MGRLSEGKSPTIGQLRYWHKAMARAAVGGSNRPGDLAKLFDLSPTQVSVITNSPLFVAERERLEALAEYEAVDVRTELQMRQGRAISVLDEALGCGDIKIMKDVALEILDRTGYTKKAEPQVNLHLHKHEHRDVKEMADEELEKEVFGLLGDAEVVGG